MKYSPILSSIIGILFLMIFHFDEVMAQSSIYDNNGKVKSVEQRRYEESERNRNKVNTPTIPTTRYESNSANTTTIKSKTNNAAHVVEVDNKYGFVVKGGSGTMKMYEDIVHENFFGEFGLYGVKLNGKWGFISETGATVIAFQYDAVLTKFAYYGTTGMYSEEGYRNVVAKVIMDNHVYTIDRYGNSIGSPIPYVWNPNIKIAGPGLNYLSEPKKIYTKIKRFYEGMAGVTTNGYKFGFIDSNFTEIVPLIYDYASDFKEGFAAVNLNGKWGFINKTGKIVIPIIYEETRYFFTNGYAAVKLNGKWGFVDKENKNVIPFLYDEAKYFYENLAKVKLNNNWGFIDNMGKVIVPFKYTRTGEFSGGYAAVQLGLLWGYIDRNGNEIIKPIYNNVYYYKNGKAKVVLAGRTFFVDSTGKEVSE